MTRTLFAALPRLVLFVLATLPVLIGMAILTAMAKGQISDIADAKDHMRWASYPTAVIGHIIGGSLMLLLGFAQFSRQLRSRFPGWHRWADRLIVAGGAFFALSGLWMNASVRAPDTSRLYDAAQNVMAAALLVVLFLGIGAIRRGQIHRHRVWMMRAYAISLGAATQTAMLFPVFLLAGPPTGLLADLTLISAWAINLTVAEMLLRHR